MNQTDNTTRSLADIQSPWNHFARRFIEAPVFHLGRHSHPIRWPISGAWN